MGLHTPPVPPLSDLLVPPPLWEEWEKGEAEEEGQKTVGGEREIAATTTTTGGHEKLE